MNVEDIASQSRVVFETVYSTTEETQFLGCMLGQQITIRQHTHSAISLPKITKIGYGVQRQCRFLDSVYMITIHLS